MISELSQVGATRAGVKEVTTAFVGGHSSQRGSRRGAAACASARRSAADSRSGGYDRVRRLVARGARVACAARPRTWGGAEK